MSTVSLYKELNFGLGETADMIRDHVNSFATNEIAPLAEKTDIDNMFPNQLWPKFGEMGEKIENSEPQEEDQNKSIETEVKAVSENSPDKR